MAGPVIVVNPGQIVPQSDWEALSHQHGDVAGESTLRAPTKPEMQAAAVAGDEDPAFEQHPIYRYHFSDGSYVEARTAPDGQSYQIVDYKPSTRFQQTHPAAGTAAGGTNTSIGTNPVSGKPTQVTTYPDGRPPTYDDTQVPAALAAQGQTTTVEGTQRPDGSWDNTQPREVTRRPDGTLVSSKPLEGPALQAWQAQNQTASAEEPVTNRPGWVQITTTQGGNKKVQFRGPDGQVVDTLPAGPGTAGRKPVEGYPGYELVTTTTPASGTTAETTETHYEKDGQRTAAPPGKPDNKSEDRIINGQHYRIVSSILPDGTAKFTNYGPDGKPIDQLPPEPSATSFATEPDGMPAVGANPREIITGLQTYSAALNKQVLLWKQTNGKQGTSPDDATKLMHQRMDIAESLLKQNQNDTSNASTAYGQDITQRGQTLNDSTSRRTAAEGILNNVNTTIIPTIRYAGHGGGALAGAAIEGALNRGRAFMDSVGGLKETPPVSPDTYPALAAIRAGSQAGIAQAANGGPQIFTPRPVTGAAPSAVGPVGAGVTATTAAALNPTGANVQAANDATMQGSNAAFGGLGIGPGAAPPINPADEAAAQASLQQANAAANAPSSATAQAANEAPVATNPIGNTPITLPNDQPGATISPIPNDQSGGGVQPLGAPQSVMAPPAGQGDVMMTQPGSDGGPASDPGAMLPPKFMQEARYGSGNYWDPHVHGAALATRLGIPPEIFHQAVHSMYG